MHKGEFFRKYGVQEASIFYGFCNSHDSSLFKDIESSNLDTISNKEAFLLLARSVFFDYFQKKIAIMRINKLIKLLETNSLPINKKDAEAWIQGCQLYIDNDFPEYEKKIYKFFESSDYSDVIYKYRKIEKAVPISLSTNINPLFRDHVPNQGKAQPFFAFHLLPYKGYGVVVLSWFKEFDSEMNWINEKFDSDFSTLINYLCFIESEDYFFSPKFYDDKVKGNKEFFAKAFFNRISFPDFGFDDTKIFFNFV